MAFNFVCLSYILADQLQTPIVLDLLFLLLLLLHALSTSRNFFLVLISASQAVDAGSHIKGLWNINVLKKKIC